MNRTRSFYVLAALLLATVLGALIAKTRSVDFDTRNQVVALLRQLKQIDAEWNVDVLRSRTGLNADYDPVASPLPALQALEDALRSKSGELWSGREASRERIQPLLDAYRAAMARKTELIERFKSQNAILRNSSRYLPVAAQELLAAAGAGGASAARTDELARLLNALLSDTMSYAQSPEPGLRQRIEAVAGSLEAAARGLPGDAGESAQTLVRHVRTVLGQHEATTRLLAEIAAVPTARTIDELADADNREHAAVLADQQLYRHLLLAYSAALLALLGFVAWRLVRYWRMLDASNAALRQTNQALKESQAHLVQAEKMSALGQMVAGIAHEINTPLAYVKGTIEVLREQVAPMKGLARDSLEFTEKMREPARDPVALRERFAAIEAASRSLVRDGALDEMDQLLHDGVHGIEQISEIVMNLKNFSRVDRARVGEYSLQQGLESTLLLAKNLLKNRVEVRKEYAADVPAITCSPSQINQVFLNIVTNAVHAIPEERHGTITLRTLRDGDDFVRVEIQDDGTGIPKDVQGRIFDPFFTTKPIGKGTGLGLSISYKIVADHGGRIEVSTEEGVGTVFAIVLPVRVADAAEPAVIGEREPAPEPLFA